MCVLTYSMYYITMYYILCNVGHVLEGIILNIRTASLVKQQKSGLSVVEGLFTLSEWVWALTVAVTWSRSFISHPRPPRRSRGSECILQIILNFSRSSF